jgi:hypothetical protein
MKSFPGACPYEGRFNLALMVTTPLSAAYLSSARLKRQSYMGLLAMFLYQ